MQKGVYLFKTARQTIPLNLAEPLILAHQSCHGVAVSHQGKITTVRKSTGLSLETFRASQEQLKMLNVLYYLGNFEKGYNEGDIQPYTILTSKTKGPALIGFMQGDFTGHAKDASTRPPAYFFVKNYLTPKILQLYKLVGGDMGKLIKELREATVVADINNQCLKDGWGITLMVNNGPISENDKSEGEVWSYGIPAIKNHDWGFASPNLKEGSFPASAEDAGEEKEDILGDIFGGDAEEAEEEDKAPSSDVVPESALAGLDQEVDGGVAEEAEDTTAETAEEQKKTTETKVEDAKKSETVVTGQKTVKKVQCPKTIKKKEDIAAYYQEKLGWKPANFKNYPIIEVVVEVDGKGREVVKSLKDIPTAMDRKDTTVKHLPAPKDTAPKGPAVVATVVPVVSPTEAKKMEDEFKKRAQVLKTLDLDGREMAYNPAHFQEMVKKYGDFCKQSGIKHLGLIKGWNLEDLLELCRSYPRYSMILILELMDMIENKRDFRSTATPGHPPEEAQGEKEDDGVFDLEKMLA